MIRIAILLCLLAAAPAFAQDARQPCQRGPSTLRMGGVDMDETRCVEWLSQQEFGKATAIEQHLRAQILLGTGDLAAARRQLADLAAYAKACGDKPGCFAPVEEAK